MIVEELPPQILNVLPLIEPEMGLFQKKNASRPQKNPKQLLFLESQFKLGNVK